MNRNGTFGLAGTIALVALMAVGCSAGSTVTPKPTATPSVAPVATLGSTAVNVTLSEWAIGTSAVTAPAGVVTFTVTNQGPKDVHEFVILKTDLSMISLPVDSTGKATEDGSGVVSVDEIGEVAVGATQDLVVTLEPGAYVLVCNIVDETTHEAHYGMGMRTSFTVTP